MSLFEFELLPVDVIEPWGDPSAPSLSWFALSLGRFHMPVGGDVLFRYSAEARIDRVLKAPYPDYQIAAFARDVLGAVRAALAPVPPLIEAVLRDEASFLALDAAARADASDDNRGYVAWRWLGERSPWTGYLSACPRFWFVRVDDEIWTQWDNSECSVEGVQLWTASRGDYPLSVGAFMNECRGFANRLLAAMDSRLTALESGTAVARCVLDLAALRKEHAAWEAEFVGYFAEHTPDFDWPEVERALRNLAQDAGIRLPDV